MREPVTAVAVPSACRSSDHVLRRALEPRSGASRSERGVANLRRLRRYELAELVQRSIARSSR